LGSPYPGSARGLVISPMPLWGCNPHAPPGGLRPPDPLWGFAPRPPAGYFGSRSLGLRPLPPAGYFGTVLWGFAPCPPLVTLGPVLWGFRSCTCWSSWDPLFGVSGWGSLWGFGRWARVVTVGPPPWGFLMGPPVGFRFLGGGRYFWDEGFRWSRWDGRFGGSLLAPPVTVGAGVSFLLVTSGTNFHTPWLPLGRGQGHGLALPRGSWTGWPRVGQPAGRD